MNFALSLILSRTRFEWPESEFFKISADYGERPLDGEEIERLMANTQEPAQTDTGMLCMIASILLCNLCLPWYGDSYDGCDVVTYALWKATTSPEDPKGRRSCNDSGCCNGGAFIGGIPR